MRYTKSGYKRIKATAKKLKANIGSQRKRKAYQMKGAWLPVAKRVRSLERMIETKEGSIKTADNVALPHNQVTLVQNSTGAVFNPLFSQQGAQDPMGANDARRIGDKITVRGLLIRAFMENALERTKVYYRFMVIKCAKGDTINRANLFKGDSDNKMIDQINTERFTIVAQKTFNIVPALNTASVVSATGVPSNSSYAGIATKTFKMWIPGRKFGRGGNIVYEDGGSQPKFFDYRLVFVVYDWFGTPQDVNNVGRINSLYTKLYFKDA